MSNDPGPQKQPLRIVTIQVNREIFRFNSFDEWANKASSSRYSELNLRDSICVDMAGRLCWTSKEFLRARDDGAFPVVVYET